MPTTRRSSGRGVVSTGKQSKLSFNNRVTKSVPKPAKDLVAPSPLKKEIIAEKAEEADEADLKTEEQAEPEPEPELKTSQPEVTKSDAERKAEKISDAAIQKYWRKLEQERTAKRVHQNDLTTNEKVLRYFDVSSQYGPCIGITRLKRWQRAQRLGLNPPIEVLAVLLREEAKGSKSLERSHMDEIMNPAISS